MKIKQGEMKLKILSILLICSILIQLIIPLVSFASSVTVTMSSTATQLKAGDTVYVNLCITGDSIAGLSGYLDYDTTVFGTVKSSNLIVPSELQDDGNGDWIASYTSSTKKVVLLESSGNYYTIPNGGLLVQLKLSVIKDTDSSTIKLSAIEVDGNLDYYEVSEIECNLPKEVTTYTISYNANTTDPVTGMPSNGTKNEGSDYTIEAGPTRTNYTFTGWNTKNDGTGTPYAAGSTYSADADLELYAQWEAVKSTLTVDPNGGVWEGSSATQTFTEGYGTTKTINNPTSTPNGNVIKFNGNGGTSTKLQETQTTTFSGWTGATLNGTTYTFGTSNKNIKANYTGNDISLPNATKTGATFKGWYDAATGGNLIGGAGDTYSPAYTTPNASITLFAQYQEDTYTLTINPNGGTYNGNTTVSGTYNSSIAIANPIAPNGYTVTLNNEGTTSQLVQTKTFKQWNVVSGNGTISGTTYTFGTQNGEIQAEYESNSVNLAEPSKEGYTFDGWYTQATGGTKITSPYMPTSDITLYAHWTANTYTITFNPGTDGTVNPTSKIVTYDQPYGTLPTPTRPGYTFNGWVDQNGNPITETDVVNITSDTQLTATWQGQTYTLTIDPNGGTYNGSTNNATKQGEYQNTVIIGTPVAPNGYTITLNNEGTTSQLVQTKTFKQWNVILGDGTINGTTYTFGTQNGEIQAEYESNSINLTEPSKEGYTFDGWYTQVTGGTEITSPYMPTSDITLYARWTPGIYQLTFDPGQDGTVSPRNMTAIYDQPYGTLPTPTRPGFDFDGWEDPNGNLITETDIVKITTHTILTARWLGTEYTVTFDPDGGQVNPTSKKVRNEGRYGELPTPIKTGYTFKGWINSNGDKITSTTTVDLTADETLTADWEENKYTITFDPGTDGTVNEPTREVKYGDTYGTLPIPTKPGYVFDGWYGPDGNKIEETDVIDILTDITVTAGWTGEEYTLTFDYDGGTGNEASRTIQNGLAYGTLPIANKTGYTFKGWFDSNGKEVQGTEIVNTTSDVTLYAKYDINKYKVTFKNDDGTIIKTIDVEYGKNAQYTGNIPVKSNVQDGYEATFNGWQDASKLSNITEDVTVTATYTISPKVYTITYNNLKDSDNSANPTTYTIEDSNITLVDLPNQGKYIFKGWYTTNDETGTKVTSIDTSKLGNIILHAQWENDSLYFRSEKYKVGENDIDNYENGDIYLDKIEPETTLSELIDNCDTNGTITVINENGQTLSSGDLVGTTMTIKVTRNDEEITMTIVVMGDIDGDGKATTQDLSELNKAYLGISEVELTGARFKAADIDDSQKITATDFSELNRASLGISKLIYNKPNKQ